MHFRARTGAAKVKGYFLLASAAALVLAAAYGSFIDILRS